MIEPDEDRVETPAQAAAALLRALPAERLPLPAGIPIGLAAGIARYRLSADRLTGRAALGQIAYRWGWRFFLATEGRLLPAAIDIRPARDAGTWRAGLANGPRLVTQLAALDRLDQRDDLEGRVRLLDAPGLDWTGLWITGSKDSFLALPSLRLVNPERLVRRLRKTANVQRRARIERGDEA